jgi:mRNA-degrading endonuclease RelE of RelBE toxin-antitoxin system
MTNRFSDLSGLPLFSDSKWQVNASSDFEKKISRLPQKQRILILKALAELEESGPSHRNIKKLQARPEWSMRVGSYRVILRVDFVHRQMLAVDAGSRGDIYKK